MAGMNFELGTEPAAPDSGFAIIYPKVVSGTTKFFLKDDASNVTDLTLGGASIEELTGDVTAVGPGIATATIANDAITNAKVSPTAGILLSKLASLSPNKVAVSDGSGVLSASSVSTTTLGYLDATSSIQGQFNARPTPEAPTVNAWVYVSQHGNDTTGDGTYDRPFATTTKAQSIITDASTSKRYGIHIRGTITETNIYLAPFTWYYGDTWGCSRLNATSGNIVLDPTKFVSGNSRCGMTNVYLTGSTGINLNFVSVAAAGSHVVEIDNIGCNGSVTINPNNTNQYFQFRGAFIFGGMTFNGALGFVQNCFVAGNISVNQMATAQACGGLNLSNMVVGGAISVTSSGSFANPLTLSGCLPLSTVSASNTGASITSDVSSLPVRANVSITSGAVLNRVNDAFGLGYTPTTAGDWSTVPSVTQSALDSLAVSGIAKQQTQAKVLASPTGSTGLPTFRAIERSDLPANMVAKTLTDLTIPDGYSYITTRFKFTGRLRIQGNATLKVI